MPLQSRTHKIAKRGKLERLRNAQSNMIIPPIVGEQIKETTRQEYLIQYYQAQSGIYMSPPPSMLQNNIHVTRPQNPLLGTDKNGKTDLNVQKTFHMIMDQQSGRPTS